MHIIVWRMWITMWKSCEQDVENVKKPCLSRIKWWKSYSQNKPCKSIISVHIILLQEDSMSGGYVFISKEGRVI